MFKCAVILAAGEGKRMKSNLPKVLHKVCGKEMVNHVIDIMRKAGIEEVDVIVGRGAEEVKEATKTRKVAYSFQENQLGTGHAVKCANDFLKDKHGTVAIFTGDAPLIQEETIKKFVEFHENGKYKCSLLTSIIDEPGSYGRIIRNSVNELEKIVEFKDCNEEEAKVKEINAGMYCFDIKSLLQSLEKLNNDNAQGEYYLTDIVEILKGEGEKIGAMPVAFEETIGVNSRVELSEAEKILKNRINRFHMVNGVTIIDPENTYIGADVEIGNDTIIYPGNILEGKTVIKSSCVLYPNSRIQDAVLEEGVIVQSSVILESVVGQGTAVGPFAYIRPESNIGKHVKIGDFVEIKKSSIGDNTKISHLTYVGDAEVGTDCNFGCGTITSNYDGSKKYKTIIGNHAFIGCNTNLVAPVKVNDNTYIAAGSTITDEVPEGALAIARTKQINKDGWVAKNNEKKSK